MLCLDSTLRRFFNFSSKLENSAGVRAEGVIYSIDFCKPRVKTILKI
jgi:hypothetical protein